MQKQTKLMFRFINLAILKYLEDRKNKRSQQATVKKFLAIEYDKIHKEYPKACQKHFYLPPEE